MARWIKRGTARVPPPVTNMLFPITLLFLTRHTDASPTIVELINSGLSLVGAKYVPPPSSEAENEIGTRQTTCRDCSRKVNATPGFHLRRTTVFFSGKICLGHVWDSHNCTCNTAMLCRNKQLRQMRIGKDSTGDRGS